MTDMPEKIAGKTLSEWAEFARRDDCLDQMVPSDLRQLVGAIDGKTELYEALIAQVTASNAAEQDIADDMSRAALAKARGE